MEASVGRTLGFAAAVCVGCAVIVASTAVGLRDRIDENRQLDRQSKVLQVSGLLQEGATPLDIAQRFDSAVSPYRVELSSGAVLSEEAEHKEQTALRAAPENAAGVREIPTVQTVFRVRRSDGDLWVLPIEGKGLWSTMYGYLALDARDLTTVYGIEFYEHGETPGLGGEIDNPRWKASFAGRQAFDGAGNAVLEVARRQAGSALEDPHRVDALTGATLTARGVTETLRFWLGDHGYGPFLVRQRRLLSGGGA